MKLKLLLLFFLGSLLSANAQKIGSLSGKVSDKNNTPISYASIVLKADNKVITGGITDDNGLFEIKNLELKKYAVEIQFIGYKAYSGTADFSSGQKSIAIPKIVLEEEATQLSGVNVVAERSTIEQKIDRKVINVGKDLTTAGATASDIMSNIPSVNVDQDGKLSLRGNENVRVLIDGRPTNIDASQLLKQIPSSSIKKIELITNPSAKYNPEGMSGIINIVLHKNANDGFNATINAGLTVARTPKPSSSIDLNYRTGKINFFGNYGNNFGEQYNHGLVKRLSDSSYQEFDVINNNKNHLFKAGMDYFINDKNTVSVYTNQNIFSGTGPVNTNFYFTEIDSNFISRDNYRNANRNGTYNLAYKHLFEKEGHTLDFEGNYNDYHSTQNAAFFTDKTPLILDDPAFTYNDNIIDDRKNSTVNVDYVNPLSEKSTLELGAESRIVRTDNVYRTSGKNLPNSNYSYDLDIYSAYATFGQKFKKFSYQLGARFESYKVNATLDGATAYKDDYITMYPSAYLSYALTDKNNFQLSYSRRVDRPSLEQTKPIREFSTARLTSIGNPALDPQFTNSVELNYTRTITKGSISGGVFYRIINDEIARVLFPDENKPGAQIMTFTNYDRNSSYGFELSANYKINSWWDIQPAIDFSSLSQKGAVSILIPRQPGETVDNFETVLKEITANSFNARMNSNFKATKNLRLLLFGFYRGAVDGIQFNRKEMYKIDAGARYSFLNNKATISIRSNDVFDTMKFAFEGDNPYPQNGEFKWESQSLFFGFNYMFGSGKNKALQRKKRDDNTKQGGGGLF
ncbi:TonB-dependent receptor [Flavobacterium noncentrifugens]|uniref:Outer membrane receptor proteins, mostly Fe transport n=1 Tax=Flavobacterium noncentrifugens TaxID=1128970 RepID=A0A1G8VFW4_9FLAO|nr:outer membrane beta-barrel family protein [Flavobacterium noncentrifugens]GEP50460.1 TonB-dependent receptor [Flavobacterium noncentrifugens]SDJ64215.1 Outer membrane receptor proteins, mostly Fe transport [Flavobacterium noncentrifugens]